MLRFIFVKVHYLSSHLKTSHCAEMNKKFIWGLSAWFAASFLGFAASAVVPMTLDKVIGRLESVKQFAANAEYAVTLPQAQDDIVYNVKLESTASEGDSLCEADYLIQWKLPTPSGLSEGFLSYFDGHHYRLRDRRLQEYHFQWDSIPFLTRGGGVQRNGQFVDLLPQLLGTMLRRMASDTLVALRFNSDTIVGGKHVIGLTAVESVRGYTGRIMKLLLDAETAMPLLIDNEFNPGQISEQLVVVRYSYPADEALPSIPATEEALIERFPEVFEKYRESNYSIENLRGELMPAFSLATPTRERYTYAKGDGFHAPTIIAIIDPEAGFASETVAALRSAATQAPRNVDLIMAFVSGNPDRVEELTGELAPGETVLMSARSLARDCGAVAFPAIIIADESGRVTNVMLGFNNSLASDVIQSVAIL